MRNYFPSFVTRADVNIKSFVDFIEYKKKTVQISACIMAREKLISYIRIAYWVIIFLRTKLHI